MSEKKHPDAQHGKKPNQKLKPYLVLQYLQKETDEENLLKAPDIVAYLESRGIDAERRSIYRDIEEINKIMLLADDEEMTIQEAEEILADDEEGAEKTIVYDKSKKGFYVSQRHYSYEEIRLLAEAIYSAKFLSEKQTKDLIEIVCGLVSRNQAGAIRHDAFLTDRVRTINKNVIGNITAIDEAMSKTVGGEKHIPEKISFKYLKYSIDDLGKQSERRKGERYIVSPYALLINDGYYYLLAYNDFAKALRTYRVDRMKDVRPTGEPREGGEAFAAIDLKTYTQRVFSMFGGDKARITIRFINPLLDAAVDRFGTKGVLYSKMDDAHFTVNVPVEVSDQFFSWICQFGKKAKILAPESVVDRFTEYIDKIRSLY